MEINPEQERCSRKIYHRIFSWMQLHRWLMRIACGLYQRQHSIQDDVWCLFVLLGCFLRWQLHRQTFSHPIFWNVTHDRFWNYLRLSCVPWLIRGNYEAASVLAAFVVFFLGSTAASSLASTFLAAAFLTGADKLMSVIKIWLRAWRWPFFFS